MNRISHDLKREYYVAWFLWVQPVYSLFLSSELRLGVWIYCLILFSTVFKDFLFGPAWYRYLKLHTESPCLCLAPGDNSKIAMVTLSSIRSFILGALVGFDPTEVYPRHIFWMCCSTVCNRIRGSVC